MFCSSSAFGDMHIKKKVNGLSYTQRLSLFILYLVIMHFNDNVKWKQAKTLQYKTVYQVMFLKYKKEQCTEKPVKTKQIFSKQNRKLLLQIF